MEKQSRSNANPDKPVSIPDDLLPDMKPAPKGPCVVNEGDVFLELNSNQFGIIEIHRCRGCGDKAFCWSRTFEQWVTIPGTSVELMPKLVALVSEARVNKAPGWT